MFENIDYDGFKDYCKKTLSKNTVPQYQTYLRNFISYLEDNKIYSVFDYYDLKSKNPKYLEEEFLKSGKTKKSFADYNSAVSKYIEFINSKGITMPTTNNEIQKHRTNFSLNQILYGPPGTGKTYSAIKKALEIIEGNASNDKSKFKSYVENGQIKFVTFHQSYGYEEFIEGIKPVLNDNEADSNKEIKYDIEDGVFKKLCKIAKSIEGEVNKTLEFNENVNFWKMSLGNSQNPEEDFVFEYCIKNNVVLLGFGNWIDFSDCENIEQISKRIEKEKTDFSVTAINRLKNEIKNGDIILISLGNKKLRAVARVIGEYEFLDQDDLDSFVQARRVEWIFVPDEPIDYDKFLYRQFSQMSIYNIKYNLKIDEFKQIFTKDSQKIEKNYVLIIDEINRGNISKIFGELITLIEPSKRLVADDEIMVELPYSKEKFGVPSNLYIIGTMNTADRSIALMDTALRRRFEFVEMMPEYDKLNEINIEGINIGKMLKTINERIEYLYDRDHTIGHAYFINVSDLKTLANVFKNKILPLLQEYFYDDWEKIRLVLGDSQKDENLQLVKIKRNMAAERLFRGKIDYIDDKILYEINSEAFNNPQSYIEIYKNATKSDNDN